MTRRRVRSSRAGRVYLAQHPRRRSPPAAPTGSADGGALAEALRDLGSPSAPAATFVVFGAAYRNLTAALLAAASATLHCPACGVRACGPGGVCAQCADLLRTAVAALPAPTGDHLWLGPHAGIWRRLVHALKYRNAHRLADLLARLLQLRVDRWGWSPHLITHVPTTRQRRLLRGYDQAQLLATALARHTGADHASLLRRRASTRKLVGQGRTARSASLARALVAQAGTAVRGRSVLLVDDVMTTGATLTAARQALHAAGAAEVRAAFVARTAPTHEESGELRRALALLEPPS